jgi:hypothetical protein
MVSNNDWSFETALHAQTQCEIHTFDCTGDPARFQKPKELHRVHFHHWCVGYQYEPAVVLAPGEDGDRKKIGASYTLGQMQKSLGHKRLDLLKIDAEGTLVELHNSVSRYHTVVVVVVYDQLLVSNIFFPLCSVLMDPGYEWHVIEDWYTNFKKGKGDQFLPMQVAMELHAFLWFSRDDLPAGHRSKQVSDIANLNEKLQEMGYAIMTRNDNPGCEECTELTLLRYQCFQDEHEKFVY